MADKKGKKEKKPFNRYKMYKISGDKLERKNKTCPKCGSASYLAEHKNRLSCGKCNYTEFKK
ncbi:30S ribosomal protein S27ae [Candidatus Woesearchaeota archaeon]|nr:30S ribosomal protein S27ae [Candidatus Woesearchaeota archaeon]